jgi:hypothetical protein
LSRKVTKVVFMPYSTFILACSGSIASPYHAVVRRLALPHHCSDVTQRTYCEVCTLSSVRNLTTSVLQYQKHIGRMSFWPDCFDSASTFAFIPPAGFSAIISLYGQTPFGELKAGIRGVSPRESRSTNHACRFTRYARQTKRSPTDSARAWSVSGMVTTFSVARCRVMRHGYPSNHDVRWAGYDHCGAYVPAVVLPDDSTAGKTDPHYQKYDGKCEPFHG